MGLFGRKENTKKEIERVTKEIDEILKRETILQPEAQKPPKETQEKLVQPEKIEEIKKVAPLFVKIEKYEQILNSLHEMKAIVTAVKNAFRTLNETEKMREESIKIIENTLDKMEKKLIILDSEFSRPIGFREKTVEPSIDMELETSLEDIKNQLEGLKTELQTVT